jgi:hypothetical protein
MIMLNNVDVQGLLLFLVFDLSALLELMYSNE